MDNERYMCRKCGWQWSALKGEEEPPDCPECESDDIERLEVSTFGRPITGKEQGNEK